MPLFGTKQERLNKRLFKALRNDKLERVKKLLAEGADVNAYDDYRDSTPLYTATDWSFPEAAQLLLEKGADAHFAKKGSGYTVLMKAAYIGDTQLVEALLAKGVDIEARDDDGRTALHKAASNGDGDMVKLLLKHGADRNATDKRMNTPADVASKYYPRVAELIRGETRQPVEPLPAAIEAVPDKGEGWRLTAKDEVANVSLKSEIGYRLTEVFNFTSGTYMRIAQNLETGAESQSLKFFDEFADAAAIERARAALAHLGGTAKGAGEKLDKPSMPAPRAANGGKTP
ncbi:MAG: hypothetical protein GC185_00460 [Alphaproteobacteria bacterium]|nr:hypothetical protein [Alphaproteobacteria bacterium]